MAATTPKGATRPMTERAAWLWLAKAWRGAVKDEYGDYVADGRSLGLCPCVGDMKSDGLIGVGTAVRMKARLGAAIRAAGVTADDPVWPTNTAAGRRARVRFCERQAKALERKATT